MVVLFWSAVALSIVVTLVAGRLHRGRRLAAIERSTIAGSHGAATDAPSGFEVERGTITGQGPLWM